jgi:hypothetical protein
VAASVPPHARSVHLLRDRLDVSAEVAGRALAQAHQDHLVAGLLLQVNPRTQKDLGWRVAWAAGSWAAGTRFLPENVRLRCELIERAARHGEAEGVGDVAFGQTSGRYYVAARKHGQQLVVTLGPA